MMDVYEKDVIHIFLHIHELTLHTLKHQEPCSYTPPADKLNDISKGDSSVLWAPRLADMSISSMQIYQGLKSMQWLEKGN